MAGRVYSLEEVKQHDKESDAWVVFKGDVFDVTKFIKEHPGGSSIVVPHLGTDISEAFVDDDIHVHSRSAHDIIKRYKIGEIGDGSSKKSTQIVKEEKKGKELDFTKPIIFQVGTMGTDYIEYIHKPQALDEPARFFEYDFFEFFSRTPWYVVPLFWGPIILYIAYHCLADLKMSGSSLGYYFVAGLFVWTLIEYVLHRFIFHLDELMQHNYWTITLHFVLHGVHHLLPMDPMRLVLPPIFAAAFAIPIIGTLQLILGHETTMGLATGGLTGYVLYDICHYYLHHCGRPSLAYFRDLKTYHLAHHYDNYHLAYGITNKVRSTPGERERG